MNSDTILLELHNSEDLSLIFIALQQLEQRSGYSFGDTHLALQELLENTLMHAYNSSRDIDIRVTLKITACQLYVILQEFGQPFDFTPYRSEAIDGSSDHSKGFYRIYDLVDYFYFTTQGKEGKRFTLISHLSNCQLTTTKEKKHNQHLHNIDEITTRTFSEGDEEAISQLIYHNYDYTYYKPLFYNPKSIKVSNHSNKVYSIVAISQKKVIGHFALLPHEGTHCAEVAIAVVQPEYKGLGIMNLMFDRLITEAQKQKYRSIFGEAIMLHPYSQKANLKKGMRESALVLGLVPEDIEIEHELKIGRRSGVLLGYLLFEKQRHPINIPAAYKEQIEKSYQQFKITEHNTPLPTVTQKILTHLDEELNLGTLQIDLAIDETTLTQELEQLMLEQTDMIYADINLHRIQDIDLLIEQLQHHGFFYSGILFDYYHDEEYLRLQKVCSKNVEVDNLVTYSSFGKELLDFIKEDRERVHSHRN